MSDPEVALPSEPTPEDTSRNPQGSDPKKPRRPASDWLAEKAGRIAALPSVILAEKRKTSANAQTDVEKAKTVQAGAEKKRATAQKGATQAGTALLGEEMNQAALGKAERRATRARGNAIVAREKGETAEARKTEALATSELRAVRDGEYGYVGLDDILVPPDETRSLHPQRTREATDQQSSDEQPVGEIRRGDRDPVPSIPPERLFSEITPADRARLKDDVDRLFDAMKQELEDAHLPVNEAALRNKIVRDLLREEAASESADVPHLEASSDEEAPSDPQDDASGDAREGGESRIDDSSDSDEAQERKIANNIQQTLRLAATPGTSPQTSWNPDQREYFATLSPDAQHAWTSANERGDFDTD